jgi:hypothetical protein
MERSVALVRSGSVLALTYSYAHAQLRPGGLIAAGDWNKGSGVRDLEQDAQVARSC